VKAAGRLPCSDCDADGPPDLRKPRLFSDAWHRDPSSYFACPGCGLRLAALSGPASERPSQVAIDRIPDPAGTLRAMISRDPRWFRSLTAADRPRVPLSLAGAMDGRLAGIEFRADWRVRVPPAPGSGPSADSGTVLAPAALLRHGMPWVVWSLESVERIVDPRSGHRSSGAGFDAAGRFGRGCLHRGARP
jgi:hypothetical protein